jgi:hypothetical protein
MAPVWLLAEPLWLSSKTTNKPMDQLQSLKSYNPICMEPSASDLQKSNANLFYSSYFSGGVSERPKEPVLKTGVVQATVGSNPTPTPSKSFI